MDILREELVRVCADTPGAQSAVAAAFPVLPDGTPTCCVAATACAVPFHLDPVVALRDAGPVPGRVVHDCLCYVVGVAAMICGGVASDVAADVARRVRLPLASGVLSLLPPPRTSAQDAHPAGSLLVDGACV